MSITIEYLDGLEFEVVKQKYYNANKVNAKLEEFKAGVRELIEENEALKKAAAVPAAAAPAAVVSAEDDALNEAAQKLAEATVKKAESRAARIIDAANSKAKSIIDEAKAEAERIKGESASKPVEKAVPGQLSAAQLDMIDELNRQLDSLNTSQATQIFKLKQQLMNLVIGK